MLGRAWNVVDTTNILKALLVKGIPISYTAIEETNVDIVKVVWRVNPVAAAVVDLKMEIGRKLVFLDAGKIRCCLLSAHSPS